MEIQLDLNFPKFFSTQSCISPVLIKVACSFSSKNTQWIKFFLLSFRSLKSVESEESYARNINSSLSKVTFFSTERPKSQLLIEVNSSFWSKNTQWIKLFLLSF